MTAAEKPINVIEALNRALNDALESAPQVLVLGEDRSGGTITPLGTVLGDGHPQNVLPSIQPLMP